MKILWHSNAPFVGSGYGEQCNLFSRVMAREGHNVVVAGFYGHRGSPMKLEQNLTVFPSSYAQYGADVLDINAEIHQPDVYIGLIDVWVYERAQLAGIRNLTWWVPIDHDPIPPLVVDRLKGVANVWAMSRFGERELKRVGLACEYVPHGVDTKVFKPLEKDRSRKSLGWEAEFIAVSVASNKGFPSRKNLPEILKAWGEFVKIHPNSMLYLHTETSGQGLGGFDVEACARYYGIGEKQIQYPNQYQLMMGMYQSRHLAQIYSAGDVLVMPSAGEGFGVPAIEAQACGLPVMVTDATAQAELCGSGWRIAVDEDDKIYTLQNSEQFRVKPSRIREALERAWEARGDESLRDAARDFALQYDKERVWGEFMLPAIEKQQGAKATLSSEREARTKIRKQMRGMQ